MATKLSVGKDFMITMWAIVIITNIINSSNVCTMSNTMKMDGRAVIIVVVINEEYNTIQADRGIVAIITQRENLRDETWHTE